MTPATSDRTASQRFRRVPGGLGAVPTAPTVVLVALLLALGLAGCSGSDDDKPAERPRPSASTARPEVATNAKLGVVRGPLRRAKAQRVATVVTRVVERWSEEAYGGAYPRSGFGSAFGDFTRDARALARRQPTIMSNARLGPDLEAVEVLQRVVRVDVAGPRGRAAGATARFRLKIALSGRNDRTDRTDLVSGRLLLTPTKHGWQVFGFDVSREEVAK